MLTKEMPLHPVPPPKVRQQKPPRDPKLRRCKNPDARRNDPIAILRRSIKEETLQTNVIEMAHAYHWVVAHFRSIKDFKGRWWTPVSADGAGFPDLVLARRRVVLFVELKAEVGELSDPQKMWQLALPCHHVWRPKDWMDGTIDGVLREIPR